MNIQSYGLAFATLVVVGSVAFMAYANNKDDNTQISSKSVEPVTNQSSGRTAYIDPETGKLISPPKGISTTSPVKNSVSTHEFVQTFHPDGSASIDTSNFRSELQATIDKSGKVKISHTEVRNINKNTNKTTEKKAKEMRHETH